MAASDVHFDSLGASVLRSAQQRGLESQLSQISVPTRRLGSVNVNKHDRMPSGCGIFAVNQVFAVGLKTKCKRGSCSIKNNFLRKIKINQPFDQPRTNLSKLHAAILKSSIVGAQLALEPLSIGSRSMTVCSAIGSERLRADRRTDAPIVSVEFADVITE